VFADPFEFNIARTDDPHVTFGGGGPHHCPGAMLARAVLDELLCRADAITLGPPKVTYPNLANNMSIFDAMASSLTPR
jgi:cytochrome P450